MMHWKLVLLNIFVEMLRHLETTISVLVSKTNRIFLQLNWIQFKTILTDIFRIKMIKNHCHSKFLNKTQIHLYMYLFFTQFWNNSLFVLFIKILLIKEPVRWTDHLEIFPTILFLLLEWPPHHIGVSWRFRQLYLHQKQCVLPVHALYFL